VPDLYRRKVAALAELLEDETTRPEAMDAIRSLVDRIEVGPPDTKRGPCTVTLEGALAGLLHLAAGARAAAAGVEFATRAAARMRGSESHSGADHATAELAPISTGHPGIAMEA
jgi:hypothetical protein